MMNVGNRYPWKTCCFCGHLHRMMDSIRRKFGGLSLRQSSKTHNEINRSLKALCFLPPDWYTRVVHMALSMSRPWKHPDSGYYWFRRRVPEDLRALVGKREERLSLGTRGPVEAKRLHALKLAEIEERWSNLRQSRHELSADAISREAALAITSIQRQLDLDPYQLIDWDVDVGCGRTISHRANSIRMSLKTFLR